MRGTMLRNNGVLFLNMVKKGYNDFSYLWNLIDFCKSFIYQWISVLRYSSVLPNLF